MHSSSSRSCSPTGRDGSYVSFRRMPKTVDFRRSVLFQCSLPKVTNFRASNQKVPTKVKATIISH